MQVPIIWDAQEHQDSERVDHDQERERHANLLDSEDVDGGTGDRHRTCSGAIVHPEQRG